MKYLDLQNGSECQLVAAINAATHLGEPPVRRGSVEYERLVDFVGARYGSAVSIHRAFGYLRIWEQKFPLSLRSVRGALVAGRPVGVGVRHPNLGQHQVLIVGIRGQGRNTEIRVPNFRRVTRGQWLRWTDLVGMVEEASGEFGANGGWGTGRWIHVFRLRSCVGQKLRRRGHR